MPFTLAHPAAVLPLRRYCPRWLDFPALVAGSVCPDLGYCFSQWHVAKFSHRFLAGDFGFCLPAGLLLVFLFYRFRRFAVRLLPARQREIFEPLCRRPAGSFWTIVVSLLVGIWTHLFLDSLAHENGLLATRLPLLLAVVSAGGLQFRVCDLIYSLTTFAGVAWLALSYMNWLERAAQTRRWIVPGFKWSAALLSATLALLLSLANHDHGPELALADVGALTLLLVFLFFTAANWALRDGQAGTPRNSRVRLAEGS
jgi:hypothetical protein